MAAPSAGGAGASGAAAAAAVITQEDDLGVLLSEGEVLWDTLVRDDTFTAADQPKLLRACDVLASVLRGVERLSLFSKNEELDDVRTDLLRFLLVPFFLAETLMRLSGGDRASVLKRAIENYNRYLEDAEALKFANKEDLMVARQPAPRDPAAARTQKIAQFQRERQAKQALQEMRRKREAVRKHPGSDPEEADRGYYLSLLRLAATTASQQLRMAQQELEMLTSIAKMKAQGTFQQQWDAEHRPPAVLRHPTPTPPTHRISNFNITTHTLCPR
eukprot:TRINITY_DN23268_c0_g1_i1.p1 TRINITY_DN23268_c0_g1~~TRINITY_DN23268_c0_g1_i1.p1  ORF type:complete len:274 (-),score=59.64 TRINITY_DN23268_c0_g1_i1:572-1393(-)